jgi:hypothetical protein
MRGKDILYMCMHNVTSLKLQMSHCARLTWTRGNILHAPDAMCVHNVTLL